MDASTRQLTRDDSLEAQVALLQRRLRDGSLQRWQVELAAYCGHEVSTALMYGAEGDPRPRFHALSINAWLRGLGRWDGARAEAERALDVLFGWGPESGPFVAEHGVGLEDYAAEYRDWLVSEDEMRTAIQTRLIDWALND